MRRVILVSLLQQVALNDFVQWLHWEELKLLDLWDLDKVFELSNEVHWQTHESFELGALIERHNIERDELEAVDFELVDVTEVGIFEHGECVVDV